MSRPTGALGSFTQGPSHRGEECTQGSSETRVRVGEFYVIPNCSSGNDSGGNNNNNNGGGGDAAAEGEAGGAGGDGRVMQAVTVGISRLAVGASSSVAAMAGGNGTNCCTATASA